MNELKTFGIEYVALYPNKEPDEGYLEIDATDEQNARQKALRRVRDIHKGCNPKIHPPIEL